MPRILSGGALLLVLAVGLIGDRASRATAQSGVQVAETPTMVTLTFLNGHRLEWTKADCNLLQWQDARGVVLGRWLEFQVNMPFGYEGQFQPTNRAYVSTTTQGDTATVACTGDWGSRRATSYRFTFAGETRQWGTPYAGVRWQIALDLPSVQNLSAGIYALQPAGQPLGFRQWSVVPDNNGLQQINFIQPEASIGHGDTQQTFSLLTHPQGAFVAFAPNFGVDRTNFTGFSSRPAYPIGVGLYREWEAPVSGQATFTTPPFVYLFSDAAATRPIPQVWLDARFGTLHEQWRSLGLGRQHLHTPLDGNLTGGADWAATHFPTYQQGFLSWGQYDGNRQFLATGMFQGPRGGPANINSTDLLANPEYNLPNAEDLPAVIPGVTFPGQLPIQDPKGRGYTQGTIADLRTMLAHQRILGIRPGMWHRDYYPGCLPELADPNNTNQWSRWDKTWTCSILWKFHPDWGQQLPDGSLDPAPQAFPNNRHPAYAAWKLAWHRYWLDLGLMGFFRDSAAFPATGRVWYQRTFGSQGPAEWAYFIDLLRNGGAYVSGENPLLFSYTVGNRGNPKLDGYKEWSASLTTGGWGGWCTNQCYLDAEMAWDRRVARRFHTVVAANPCCATDVQSISSPAIHSENRAENEYFAQFVARRGIPDRVELIAPRALPSRGTVLNQPVAATGNASVYVDNPFRLPLSGRVQIGAERLLYAAPDTGSCGHWQLDYACNGLGGIIRGYEGTPVQAHAVGETVTPLDDAQHWDWDDAYWVYGQGASEVWVKYSDGSVWQRGGAAPASLPQITGVQVSGSTVTFTTDVPTSAWVEYDTFGAAEQWNGQRVPGLPPMYQRRAPADGGDPSLQTQHQIALPGLQPGALYHYRIVARGPAQVTTADATFVAGQAPTATSTPTITPSPRITPSPTATLLPVSCAPRPNVVVTSAPGAPGNLQVTVQATGANNLLLALRFGEPRPSSNELVDVAGQTGRSGAFTVALPELGVPQTQFTVRRATEGQATTVSFTVVDRCGDWPTLAGGGAGAF
jgi:hypothetical protein